MRSCPYTCAMLENALGYGADTKMVWPADVEGSQCRSKGASHV